MANNNSTTVTNLEATPSVVADVSIIYSRKRDMVEVFEIAAADNDGDTYTFFPVSLDARISDAFICNDVVTGGTDFDLGFYKITDNSLGAVIDADIVADGLSLTSARGWTSVLTSGSSSLDIPNVKQKLWQILGYASIDAAREANPTGQVYFVATANTVGTASGSFAAKLELAVD